MSEQTNSIEWYLAREGQQYGPLSEKEMRAVMAHGHLKPTDLVWRAGFDDWIPAGVAFADAAEAEAPPATADAGETVAPEPREVQAPAVAAGTGHEGVEVTASPAETSSTSAEPRSSGIAGDAAVSEAPAPVAVEPAAAEAEHGQEQPAPLVALARPRGAEPSHPAMREPAPHAPYRSEPTAGAPGPTGPGPSGNWPGEPVMPAVRSSIEQSAVGSQGGPADVRPSLAASLRAAGEELQRGSAANPGPAPVRPEMERPPQGQLRPQQPQQAAPPMGTPPVSPYAGAGEANRPAGQPAPGPREPIRAEPRPQRAGPATRPTGGDGPARPSVPAPTVDDIRVKRPPSGRSAIDAGTDDDDDEADNAPRRRGSMIVPLLLVVLLLAGGAAAYLFRDRLVALVPDGTAAPVAIATGPAQALSPTTATATGIPLLASVAWKAIEAEFPEWARDRVGEMQKLQGDGRSPEQITRTLTEAVVTLRRRHAAEALAAPPARLKALASSFVENLKSFAGRDVETCYAYIARGETTPQVIELLSQPGSGALVEQQLARVFEAVAEGRRKPHTYVQPRRGDYDRLSEALTAKGWTQEDLQLFSDPNALARAKHDRVCKLVTDWFQAQLALSDEELRMRLLLETLRPLVSG